MISSELNGFFVDSFIISICLEISSLEAIKQGVIYGLGISIVSSLAIKQEIENGLLIEVPIKNVKFLRGFRYVHHRGTHLSPAALQFISMLD